MGMPPPSGGGITLLQVLGVLEAKGPKGPATRDVDTLHTFIEALRRAAVDRARFVGDPDVQTVPTADLTSKAWVDKTLASIDPKRATRSVTLFPPELKKPDAPLDGGLKPQNTTHISVIDKDGNAAALTTTVNYAFGSCLVAKGTGVLLNDEMDDFAAQPAAPNAFGLVGEANNAVAPGKRPASSMTPLIAVGTDGTLLCAGGSGGPTIVTGVVQTVVNILDFKMDVEAAVAAPRIHAQYVPENVLVEPEVPADVRAGLERRGHKLVVPSGSLGTSVQVVLRRPGAAAKAAPLGNSELEADPAAPPSKLQPTFSAASDPRKGGQPAVP